MAAAASTAPVATAKAGVPVVVVKAKPKPKPAIRVIYGAYATAAHIEEINEIAAPFADEVSFTTDLKSPTVISADLGGFQYSGNKAVEFLAEYAQTARSMRRSVEYSLPAADVVGTMYPRGSGHSRERESRGVPSSGEGGYTHATQSAVSYRQDPYQSIDRRVSKTITGPTADVDRMGPCIEEGWEDPRRAYLSSRHTEKGVVEQRRVLETQQLRPPMGPGWRVGTRF